MNFQAVDGGSGPASGCFWLWSQFNSSHTVIVA